MLNQHDNSPPICIFLNSLHLMTLSLNEMIMSRCCLVSCDAIKIYLLLSLVCLFLIFVYLSKIQMYFIFYTVFSVLISLYFKRIQNIIVNYKFLDMFLLYIFNASSVFVLKHNIFDETQNQTSNSWHIKSI